MSSTDKINGDYRDELIAFTRAVTLRIVRSASAAPEPRHLWTDDITFEIERGVPLELIERALARLPDGRIGPATLAFVRQFFGPRAGNGKDSWPPAALKERTTPVKRIRREHWQEQLDGITFHYTVMHEPFILWISRQADAGSAALHYVVPKDLTQLLCIERGLPLETVEHALARLPDGMITPTTMAAVRELFAQLDA
jgi:hypothetical protein